MKNRGLEVKPVTAKNRNVRLRELRDLLDATEKAKLVAKSDFEAATNRLHSTAIEFERATKEHIDARTAFALALRGVSKSVLKNKERIELVAGEINVKDRELLWSQSDVTPNEDRLEDACKGILNMSYEEVKKSAIRFDDRDDIVYYELASGFVVGSSYPGNSSILGPLNP